ncbi:MAG: monovalent cation/H+ antiporter subunit D family protein, partial [Caulobacterales bacterium]|nr:monovalent cation/H+ antiporter subunit D family protein [Caulobacterales bacterium]
DAFNLFVFLEISSLSTYVLVAMGGHLDRRALTAAYNYLVLGTIGATFFVIGVGFLYMATGTLNMMDMAERLRPLSDTSVARAGFAFIVIGLGLKAAMFPLHSWLPNAYAFSPSFVTAFLASTATKVAFYALVRFLYTVFGPAFTFQGSTLVWLLGPLAVLGMLAASFQAVFQNDARRLLALSSVAQVGYMLLGLSLGTAAGLAAGLLHLFNHAVMKGTLFMALGAMGARMGVVRVRELAGMGRVMPFTTAAFAVGGLTLIGVPLTAGFVSKWYLLSAALERGWWWAAVAIAFSSILAFIYVGRMLEAAYMRSPPERAGAPAPRARAPMSMLVPMWILAVACIWFGVDASFPTDIACRAAASVLPGEEVCLGGGAP